MIVLFIVVIVVIVVLAMALSIVAAGAGILEGDADTMSDDFVDAIVENDDAHSEMVRTKELVECVDCGCVVRKCRAVKGKDRIEEIFNTAIGISLGIAHKRIVNDWYCKRCHREKTVTESGPIGTESREKAEASIRKDERKKCWQEINEHVHSGPLEGPGTDKLAERNGMIIALNIINGKL